MNRRQFTHRLSALFATPLLPTPALAGIASPIAAAARPLHHFKYPYAWAAFTARAHGKASPEMFEKLLGLPTNQAKEAYAVLMRENVLSAPNALGISRALNPINKSHSELVKLNAQKRIERALKLEQDILEQEETSEAENDSPSVNRDRAELMDETDIAATNPDTQNPDGSY
jgi:hypothetical protein